MAGARIVRMWKVVHSVTVLVFLSRVNGRNPPRTASPIQSSTSSTTLTTAQGINSDQTRQMSSTFVTRHTSKSSSYRPVVPTASTVQATLSSTMSTTRLSTANGLSQGMPASNGDLASTLPRGFLVSSSAYAQTLPTRGPTSETVETTVSSTETVETTVSSLETVETTASSLSTLLLSTRQLTPLPVSSASYGNTTDDTTTAMRLSPKRVRVSSERPGLDSGHRFTTVPPITKDLTTVGRSQSASEVAPRSTSQEGPTEILSEHTPGPIVTSDQQILRLLASVSLVNRMTYHKPNCERLTDATRKFTWEADVKTARVSDALKNLTYALSGIAGVLSVNIVNITSTHWGVKVFYQLTVSLQRVVCSLQKVRGDLRLAAESLSADAGAPSVQLNLGKFETDVEIVCAEEHLCPSGFVCHVEVQVTCVSLCDVTACGKHGHCALNQTFQPVCVCEAHGTIIYFGERCDLWRYQVALTHIWRPAAVAGLVISGLLMMAIALAVSLYLWARWKGQWLSSRVSPRPPGPPGPPGPCSKHPHSVGHNTIALEDHLELTRGTVE